MPEASTSPVKRPYIGGQAVLEGVMMRAPRSFAIVLRRRDGSLVVREREVVSDTHGWRKLPFLRGINAIVESLKLGGEALPRRRWRATCSRKNAKSNRLQTR